ncbi:uncharacterized protein EI97DRAFT_282484 [Westerdykella ornata]|uniref:Uncharacterized protein n=1 Tax=Westerdykella ornata TaxID=318751 RepID=A0A6A6JN73_WESOR|nr:uncharacterized protein EI97DRAFT_282484 [Westerdykella ornata]KAF2278061.1 hypothetical protein EI97DRAFT_282484 [Westerdykella ornata]
MPNQPSDPQWKSKQLFHLLPDPYFHCPFLSGRCHRCHRCDCYETRPNPYRSAVTFDPTVSRCASSGGRLGPHARGCRQAKNEALIEHGCIDSQKACLHGGPPGNRDAAAVSTFPLPVPTLPILCFGLRQTGCRSVRRQVTQFCENASWR